MPAYRERIYICSGKNGQPVSISDFPWWWNRQAFFEEFGDRRIDTGNPIYVDYGLLLTGVEASVWDKHCREIVASSPHSHETPMLESMQSLESRLKNARWVIVESYEWESGLD